MKTLLIVLSTLLLANIAVGAENIGSPVESFLIPSTHVNQTFEINVYVPPACAQTACPTLYFTDSDMFFDMVSGLMGPYGSLIGVGVPQQVVVGIGYPGNALTSNWFRIRLRDLHDVAADNEMAFIESLPYVDRSLTDIGHGAPEFLQFIRQELIPKIEERYAVAQDSRTYFGYSAGSMFGLYTLFSAPDTFDRYVIGSGFWASYLERMRKFADSGKSINAKLFFGAGLDESIESRMQGRENELDFVNGMIDFAVLLHQKNIPGLEYSYDIWSGENHSTAWVQTFMQGMRAVFLSGCKPYLKDECTR